MCQKRPHNKRIECNATDADKRETIDAAKVLICSPQSSPLLLLLPLANWSIESHNIVQALFAWSKAGNMSVRGLSVNMRWSLLFIHLLGPHCTSSCPASQMSVSQKEKT